VEGPIKFRPIFTLIILRAVCQHHLSSRFSTKLFVRTSHYFGKRENITKYNFFKKMWNPRTNMVSKFDVLCLLYKGICIKKSYIATLYYTVSTEGPQIELFEEKP
jgi:hypothetical protein